MDKNWKVTYLRRTELKFNDLEAIKISYASPILASVLRLTITSLLIFID